ncbi:hypothetical protein BKM63_00670 [Flavobacterium johnsoniae]|uniref:Uncharacterized protein n=1 Tax=Flavobacterium johnsoniae TaxID=986 RepID=A0A1J7CQF9_FLAJO|nr:hypothetical protein BKM63_00670 [Flavobacterium johnsoniae]
MPLNQFKFYRKRKISSFVEVLNFDKAFLFIQKSKIKNQKSAIIRVFAIANSFHQCSINSKKSSTN